MVEEIVKKGQGDWHEFINELLAFKNAVGGGKLHHIDNPLSFVNGTRSQGSDLYYFDLPDGYKLCCGVIRSLDIIKLNTGTTVMQIPDDFKPVSAMTIPISERISLMSTGHTDGNTTKFEFYYTGKNTGEDGSAYAMAAAFWYLSKSN